MLTHIYTVEVDHDFRRWLTAIGKFTWGELDYQGANRKDKIYTLSGEAIYKMSRNLWLRGTLRRDWLDSNLPGNSTVSTVVMLGCGCSIEGGTFSASCPAQAGSSTPRLLRMSLASRNTGSPAFAGDDGLSVYAKQKPRHFGRGPEIS